MNVGAGVSARPCLRISKLSRRGDHSGSPVHSFAIRSRDSMPIANVFLSTDIRHLTSDKNPFRLAMLPVLSHIPRFWLLLHGLLEEWGRRNAIRESSRPRRQA